jgi:hypothetical protein
MTVPPKGDIDNEDDPTVRVVAPECEQRRGGIDGADDQQDDPKGEIEDELGESGWFRCPGACQNVRRISVEMSRANGGSRGGC